MYPYIITSPVGADCLTTPISPASMLKENKLIWAVGLSSFVYISYTYYSGIMKTGLNAVMGPTGSGKTT